VSFEIQIFSTHENRERNIPLLPTGHGESAMPSVEEEIADLREKAAEFVALAKEHRDDDRVRQRLMTIAADLYTKAAELEEKRKRGAA
jgi:hypothetical protein